MKNQKYILGLGIAFWLLYLVSNFSFDALWGVNFIRFLSKEFQVTLLAFSLVSILFFPYLVLKKPLYVSFHKALFPSLLFAFFLFYFQGIYKNVYGDSVLFIIKMGDATTVYNSKYLYNLFSLDLSNLKLGNLTVLSGIRLFSYGFNISHQLAFKILGLVSGLLFVGLSFSYIKENIKTLTLQWVLLFVIILSPFNQLFLGHFEIYAPAFPAAVWYLITLKKTISEPSKKRIALLLISLILCVKLHFTFILLVPSFLFTLGYTFKRKQVETIINWGFFLKYIISPFIIIGVSAYFFVFKDYNDERFLGPTVDIFNRLFLPILSPESPLDRYNLFSLNHILDFISISFLWSIAAIFLLLVIAFFYKKKINWNKTELVLTGTSLLFFFLVLFAYNPLLGMPMDFDLFSVVGPLLLFFVFFCIEQIESNEFVKLTGGTLLGISLFSLAIFNCNYNAESLSKRLESLGKHTFKTYWIRSAGNIQLGLDLVKNDPKQYIIRYLNIAQELEPYAIKGGDEEYAHILWSIGKFYRTEKKDYREALRFHLQSQEYNPELPANYIGLMESNYYLNRFSEAYKHSLKLIEYKYPSKKRAYEIAIDCALKANKKSEAVVHISTYLKQWKSSNYEKILFDLTSS